MQFYRFMVTNLLILRHDTPTKPLYESSQNFAFSTKIPQGVPSEQYCKTIARYKFLSTQKIQLPMWSFSCHGTFCEVFVFFTYSKFFLQVSWESQASIVRRDTAPEKKNVSQVFDETLQSFKEGIDDLTKKIGVSIKCSGYIELNNDFDALENNFLLNSVWTEDYLITFFLKKIYYNYFIGWNLRAKCSKGETPLFIQEGYFNKLKGFLNIRRISYFFQNIQC